MLHFANKHFVKRRIITYYNVIFEFGIKIQTSNRFEFRTPSNNLNPTMKRNESFRFQFIYCPTKSRL